MRRCNTYPPRRLARAPKSNLDCEIEGRSAAVAVGGATDGTGAVSDHVL